eukprot:SAG31_NODE_10258_length_1163_cov_7.115602_1_plen_152_part_00
MNLILSSIEHARHHVVVTSRRVVCVHGFTTGPKIFSGLFFKNVTLFPYSPQRTRHRYLAWQGGHCPLTTTIASSSNRVQVPTWATLQSRACVRVLNLVRVLVLYGPIAIGHRHNSFKIHILNLVPTDRYLLLIRLLSRSSCLKLCQSMRQL